LILAVVVALPLTGCNQISAKNRHSKLQKILQEIQVHEGDERPYQFRRNEVEALESEVNQINDLIVREAYQEAADRARQRLETAPTLRDSVIQDHAAAIFQAAIDDIQIADANLGREEDPDLYAQIMETRERAREARAEQEWEDVIDLCQQIRDDVNTLLLNLKHRSEQALLEAENTRTAFDVYHAEQHAPALVVESNELVRRTRDQIDERQYQDALVTAAEALTRINETIFATKRSLSDQGMSRIEQLITEAVEHGVEFRHPDRYRSFSDKFESLAQLFYSDKFDEALAQIDLMLPDAQTLLMDTYEHQANDLIVRRGAQINHLHEAEVNKYLPGRIEVAEDLHAQAQSFYQQALDRMAEVRQAAPQPLEEALLNETKPIFVRSVETSESADTEISDINTSFRELTEHHIAEAEDSIDVAEEVLRRFDTIWDPRIDRALNPVDVQFEENKQVLRTELGQRQENARERRVTADFVLEAQPPRYNVAIELADEAKMMAEEVLDDTYRVVARNSLIELAWMVDHYEREGAGEYVTEELDRTVRLIDETRALLASENPRDAVTQAAEARAQLEIMIQSLRRVANEEIQHLRDLEVETSGMLDHINAADRLELISQIRERAEALARDGNLKDAIETAQRGQSQATQTTTQAAREWAQTEISDARARIAHADDAGAALYAPTRLQEARDLIDSARRRFESEDHLAAQRAAAEAGEKAEEARLGLILKAEEAAVRARDYDGWRFHHGALSDALVAIQRSRRSMDEGDFGKSRELATFAQQRADEITQLSRQALFHERMDNLRQSTEHAMTTGGNYFQPNELVSVLDDLAVIERTYNPNRHDDFERDLEALEAKMAILIEGTPEILEETLEGYRDWIVYLREEKGADLYAYSELEEVAQGIVSAQRNFDQGHHRAAYQDVQDTGGILRRVQLMADEFDYKESVQELLGQLEAARYQFGRYISINPEMMTRLAISPGGSGRSTALAGLGSPADFRRAVEDLQAQAEVIQAPSTRVDHQSRLLACLRNAQSAARNFEYLIIADQMAESEVRKTIDSAYEFLEASHHQGEELMVSLIEDPLRGPITMTELGRPALNRAEGRMSYGEHR
jgi:hypothetical protein